MNYPVIIWLIAFFLLGFILCRFMIKKIIRISSQGGSLILNYQEIPIPTGTGVVFSLAFLPMALIALFLMPVGLHDRILLLLLGLIGFTFLGLIDDIWGNRETTGLKGHLNLLLHGRLTTGSIKAVFGLILVFCISALENNFSINSESHWLELIFTALLLALSANSFNLFDLRPGRSCKYFYLTFIITLILGATSLAVVSYETAFLTGLAGIVLVYYPFDVRAKTMMGDAGSNALGLVLGLTIIWTCEMKVQIIYLIYLLILHLIAEKFSLSEIIAKVPFFDFLDKLGRRDQRKQRRVQKSYRTRRSGE